MASTRESQNKHKCLKDATEAARHAAKQLDLLEPKIARKSGKTTSKELPECLKQFDEHVKILQSVIPEIIQFHEAEHGDIECEPVEGQFRRKRSYRISIRRGGKKSNAYPETKENESTATYLEMETDTMRQNKNELQETRTTKIRELEDINQRNTEENGKSVKRLKMDMDAMRRETNVLQEKLKTKEKELEDTSKRNRKQQESSMERETQGLRRQVSDLQRQLHVEQTAKNEAKAELDDALTRNWKRKESSMERETQGLRRQVSDLQRQLHVEQTAKNEAKAELEDALTRLSAVASSKLRDNNPNVVDLSDQNRPSKIAEQLSELYDNEWTNAYEVLEENMNDKECCTALLNILLSVYEECKELSTVGFYERIQQSIESPVQSPVEINTKVQMSDYMKQQIKEIRKYRAKYALEAINKIVAPKIRAEKRETKEMKAYLNKCIDICWFMVVQDPPLMFTCGSRDTFDTVVFRSYTKRGSHVEFVVWPALLVNEAGSMLSKGIAQGYGEKKRPHSSTYL